jgi:phosphatidylserine decarboxylase
VPPTTPVTTPLRLALSRAAGWLADRRVPRALRAPLYRCYASATGAALAEARGPLEIYPSLAAFFVRRLVDGARPFPADPALVPAPADGRLQALDRVRAGSLLQAKGRAYAAAELLGGLATDADLEGAWAWTIYLSPRDYHRVHAPFRAVLRRLAWTGRARYSVAPRVLERRERVLVENERCALELESPELGRWWLVMVGALNVGRIRVVGVEPGAARPAASLPEFARGDELARFEMGSTVVLLLPGERAAPATGLSLGAPLRLGQPIGRLGPLRNGAS